jgi:hypothetical protein
VRLFLALLLFFFFFPRRLNVTCAGGERKKVYLYATNSLLVATAQFLDTLALRYARVLIERISFVVLVVVTEERTEALNYYSTHAYNCRNRKAFSGEKKCISKPHKLHAREAQQKNTTPRKNSHRDILPQKCPSSTTA